jgi:hypothetical protein
MVINENGPPGPLGFDPDIPFCYDAVNFGLPPQPPLGFISIPANRRGIKMRVDQSAFEVQLQAKAQKAPWKILRPLSASLMLLSPSHKRSREPKTPGNR